MLAILILLLSTGSWLGQSAQHDPSICGRWEIRFNDSVATWIHFRSDSTFTTFDAEIGEHYEGRYEIRQDTVTVFVLHGEFDSPRGEPRVTRPQKWILRGSTLGPGFVPVSNPRLLDESGSHAPQRPVRK